MPSSFIRFGRQITLAMLAACIGMVISTAGAQTTVTSNQTGTNNNFYYSFWKADNTGSVSMTLGAAGNYSTTWSGITNFTAGKGWSTGGRKYVGFSGTFDGGSNGYLAVYGWTDNPAVEYYIVENYGDWTPPGSDLKSLGTVNANDGTYNIYKKTVKNAPCAVKSGNCDSFDQYWSVRTTKRSKGTVTTGRHFDAWASLGMKMGTKWLYMIVETEGYKSNGSSNITVTDGAVVTGVSASNMSFNKGAHVSYHYNVLPLTATNRSVTFKSSNTAVATISSDGVMYGLKDGTTTITVTTAEGSFSDTGTVKVVN